MPARQPRQHYYLAGRVERPNRSTYTWREGYCGVLPNGNKLQPWVTMKEARMQAKLEGKKAVFHDTYREALAWAQQEDQ